MKPEDALKKERSEPNPERVEAIVKRAKHEVAAKDLLEFGGARIWLALLSVIGRYLSFFGRPRAEDSDGESAGKTNQRKREESQ